MLYILLSFFIKYGEQLHNIDLTFNVLKDSELVDVMYDEVQPGKLILLKDLYIISLGILRNIHLMIAMSSFLLGILIMILYYEKQ